MRKFLLTILTVALLGGGAAFAQSQWAGVSLGWPGITGYYGMEDTLGDGLDLRARLSIAPFFGLGVGVGADVLADIDQFGDANEFDLYVGGGPSLGVLGSSFYFDVTGLAGVEYNIDTSTGIFGELRLGVGYAGNFGVIPAYGGALGVNFHF